MLQITNDTDSHLQWQVCFGGGFEGNRGSSAEGRAYGPYNWPFERTQQRTHSAITAGPAF
jgi:hypothetical protein